jgi:hypothetical protein
VALPERGRMLLYTALHAAMSVHDLDQLYFLSVVNRTLSDDQRLLWDEDTRLFPEQVVESAPDIATALRAVETLQGFEHQAPLSRVEKWLKITKADSNNFILFLRAMEACQADASSVIASTYCRNAIPPPACRCHRILA